MRLYPTRPALLRIRRIDEEIRGGKSPTANRIARFLEVSPRTVQRDIEFMRESLGAPIEWDQQRNMYFYAKPGFTLPNVELTEGELVSLLIGTRVMNQYKGTPFESDLKRAFGKIEAMLPEELSMRLGELASATEFSITAPRPSDLKTFQGLTDAVRNRKRLRIVYQSLASPKPGDRVVDPYRMACLDGAWYLVAYCHTRKEVRLFVPERISSFEETGEKFDAPMGFDFDEYMSGAFKVMRGPGKPRKVRLLFRGPLARYACERRWHPSQKVSWRGDDCILEMNVTALEELAA